MPVKAKLVAVVLAVLGILGAINWSTPAATASIQGCLSVDGQCR